MISDLSSKEVTTLYGGSTISLKNILCFLLKKPRLKSPFRSTREKLTGSQTTTKFIEFSTEIGSYTMGLF